MENCEELTRYRQASELLPLRWQGAANRLGEEEKCAAEEFRLRAGLPVTVVLPEGERPIDTDMLVSAGELEQMCDRLTNYSRYAATETMRRGFLTAAGGFRVGLCGTAVVEDGACVNLKNISSAAIRLNRQRLGVAEALFPELYGGNIPVNALLLAPPGVGKTTLLRDLIRLLSNGAAEIPPQRVAVVDERGEIAVMQRGMPQMDVGRHTDILDGCPKAVGIPILLRSCNPQVIAVDEITEKRDLTAMESAANCGVALLATIHAANRDELEGKPLFQQLLKMKVFRKLVTIRREGTQRVYEVCEL